MRLRYTSNFKRQFGVSPMSTTKLPTLIDVAKHYLYSYNESKYKTIKETLKKCLDIWHSASLPTQHISGIKGKLERYMKHVDTLRRYSRKNTFPDLLLKHNREYNILFDISACKCIAINTCRCKSINRIPDAEIEFIINQRGPRQMTIDIQCRTRTSIQSRAPNYDIQGPSTNQLVSMFIY